MAQEELKKKIEELKDELKNTKVNKRTEGAVGKLKSKIAKLEEELEVKQSIGKSSGAGFSVKKEGDSTIGLLGKPSVGKSTLLSALTNKESKIGAYEFTTLDCVPGLLHHKHLNFQILDLPGIIDRASDNRGFGKKVLSVVRACDLVVLVVNSKFALDEIKMLINETKNSNIRLNKEKPNIQILKAHRGGVNIIVNKSQISSEIIRQVLNDKKVINCEILINENYEIDDLIDSVYENVEYKKAIICLNKIDLLTKFEEKELKQNLKNHYPNFEFFKISAEKKLFLEEFKDFLFDKLDFIYVYLKEHKKDTDFSKPLVVKKNSTIKKVCEKIHNSFVERFKVAKIKGSSAKFDWQQVGLEHKVIDKDQIEIILK